jgi:hypothetical protein
MAGKITIQEKSDAVLPRCPYCHEEVSVGQTLACPDCSVVIHDVCADEVSSCPTLGCEHEFRQAPSKKSADAVSRRSDNQTAMLAHLSTFAAWFVPFPFVNIIAPFIVWQVFRGTDRPSTSVHAARATNFQATLYIAAIVCIPFCWILIGFFMLGLLGLFDLYHTFRATIAASRGQPYIYPYSIEFIDEAKEEEMWGMAM